MCGLAGLWWGGAGPDRAELAAHIAAMIAPLAHRGPDGEGIWVDVDAGVGLGHRRLAILDLSPAGQQPMVDAAGRWVLVFNGEIYNFRELRQALEEAGAGFRGHSDTEVLLTGVRLWGILPTLTRACGMFALALWDRQTRTLTLARDRMGEKPLYYGWVGQHFIFGSELKALRAAPTWRGEVSRPAVAQLLRWGFIPAPETIYTGIYKLPAGHWLQVRMNGGPVASQPYWSLAEVAEAGLSQPFRGAPADAVAELEARLRQVVREQMVADVPLGAFLSGGIDSSTVVALMQAQSGRPIQTFTIGFGEAQFNEAGYAQAVAHHLGTDHTELQVTPQDCLAVIPQLPTLYDEPLADVSQIPTALVARLARQRVTVSLSGDGGDEVFGGYTPYLLGQRIWNALGFWPLGWRQGLARVLAGRPAAAWNRDFARLGLPNLYFAPGESLHRLADVLGEKEPAGVYPHLVAKWCDPSLALQSPWPTARQTEDIGRPAIEQWMVQDSQTSLPDGILAKVDRATMAVGLESRAPLLDPRIVSFAWQLPLTLKVRGSTGKWVLRQVLYRHVPRALVDRPKMGFLIPLAAWLRQPPLREWGEDLLAPERLQAEGYFRPAVIRQLWQEHQQGRYNWQMHLWPVLTLQAWLSSL